MSHDHDDEGECKGPTICWKELSSVERRRLLAAIGSGGSLSLAGCVGLFAEPESKHGVTHDEGPIETHAIDFSKQETTVPIDEDQFILNAGEEAGLDLPFWCRSGICGACLAQVDGDGHELVEMTNNEYEPLDDEAISEGYVLTCMGQPREEFSIETGVSGALTQTPTPTPAEDQGTPTGTPQPLPGQRLVFAEETTIEGTTYAEGDIVTADSMTAPHGARAFPESSRTEDNTILVHKLEPEKITEPTNTDWTDQGFVAYSAICTHLSCVCEYTEGNGPDDFCACHDAHFDPYKGAKVTGGPAPSPLPQIGVEVNDNDELQLTTEFEGGG